MWLQQDGDKCGSIRACFEMGGCHFVMESWDDSDCWCSKGLFLRMTCSVLSTSDICLHKESTGLCSGAALLLVPSVLSKKFMREEKKTPLDESAWMWKGGSLAPGRACRFQQGKEELCRAVRGSRWAQQWRWLLAAGSCLQGIPNHVLSMVNWSSGGISWGGGMCRTNLVWSCLWGFRFWVLSLGNRSPQPSWSQDSEFPLLAINTW